VSRSVAAFYALFPLRARRIAADGMHVAGESDDPLAILEMTEHAIRYLLEDSVGEDLSPAEEARLEERLGEVSKLVQERRRRGDRSETFARWRQHMVEAQSDDIDRLAALVDALPPRKSEPLPPSPPGGRPTRTKRTRRS
jgi:hypothetical protein